MPQKKISAVILLKNTFVKEYISVVLAKQNIRVLASPKNTSQAIILLEQQKLNLFFCEDDLETLEILKSKHIKNSTSFRAILLTNKNIVDDIKEYYRMGIHGVVSVTSPPQELEEAINAILNNHIYISSIYRKFIKYDEVDKTGTFNNLTRREKEILKLIARGYTNAQLAKILKISPNSINNHRGNIRKKLNLSGGKSSLLQLAIEIYRFD